MQAKTPKPSVDLSQLSPAVAETSRITIRLNPRRKPVPDARASKIGGLFLWPQSEPWPHCDNTNPPLYWDNNPWPVPDDPNAKVPFVPVLQLNAEDVPEIEFKPGADLLQILWCPLDHDDPIYVAKPYVFWRERRTIADPMTTLPKNIYANLNYIPKECSLSLERVAEYRPIQDCPPPLRQEILSALGSNPNKAIELYQNELSSCPGSKLLGYPFWTKDSLVPRCDCGKEMDHFLTLSGTEFSKTTYKRWCTEGKGIWKRNAEDLTAIQRPAFERLDGRQYIFICRQCDSWPITAVYQR